MKKKNFDYDFSGYATRSNIKCTDERVIMKDAFLHNDGDIVPLIWGHRHDDPSYVIGHALLENRDDGVYAYCKCNSTEKGETAKLLVQSGDVDSLSICANKLKQSLSNVVHGNICEVSLVISAANPGAFIDSVILHGEETPDEAVIYSGEPIDVICHSSDSETKSNDSDDDGDDDKNDDETLGDVFNTFTDKQKDAVYALLGLSNEEFINDDERKEGNDNMKHNAFEDNNIANSNDTYLTHSDQINIVEMAKKPQIGSFKSAVQIFMEENALAHDANASGFTQDSVDGNVSWLFPEYKEVRPGAPELIENDRTWVTEVLNKVHKSPISRIRTSQVDIRNIEGQMDSLRARGYTKGKEKAQTGNFKLIRRTTDPQTICVKSALHRDDILDITDFSYIDYLYNIDKHSIEEELAVAVMIGDGRDDGDSSKIYPEHIRPIWLDDELYTIHTTLDIEKARQELNGTGTTNNFGENYIRAEAMINSVLYSLEKYKGSGTPDMFITPHDLNVMLLARDMNGRRIYSSVSELASTLNVGKIHTVEQFAGKTRKVTESGVEKTKKLSALIVNLSNYSLGATKGGELTHFTQFDIDFNQEKSLLETRCSGALTRVQSAIAIEEDVTSVG